MTIEKALTVTDLLALADRVGSRFRRIVLAALGTIRRRLAVDPWQAIVREALASYDYRLADRLGLWQELTEEMAPDWRAATAEIVLRGAPIGAAQLPPSVQVQLRFDLSNPYLTQTIETVVRASLAQIMQANQEGLLHVLQEGFAEGIGPEALARRMRQYLGATGKDATALANFRRSLEAQEVRPGRIDELVAALAERQVRQRALVIARTESIRAANAAQQVAWTTAAAERLLPPSIRRYWVVTDDDRLCPLCEAVPVRNPNGVGLTEPFHTPLGPVLYPGLHPQCRCTVTLHTAAAAEAA